MSKLSDVTTVSMLASVNTMTTGRDLLDDVSTVTELDRDEHDDITNTPKTTSTLLVDITFAKADEAMTTGRTTHDNAASGQPAPHRGVSTTAIVSSLADVTSARASALGHTDFAISKEDVLSGTRTTASQNQTLAGDVSTSSGKDARTESIIISAEGREHDVATKAKGKVSLVMLSDEWASQLWERKREAKTEREVEGEGEGDVEGDVEGEGEGEGERKGREGGRESVSLWAVSGCRYFKSSTVSPSSDKSNSSWVAD